MAIQEVATKETSFFYSISRPSSAQDTYAVCLTSFVIFYVFDVEEILELLKLKVFGYISKGYKSY